MWLYRVHTWLAVLAERRTARRAARSMDRLLRSYGFTQTAPGRWQK
jgi:hypothetical protein